MVYIYNIVKLTLEVCIYITWFPDNRLLQPFIRYNFSYLTPKFLRDAQRHVIYLRLIQYLILRFLLSTERKL